MFDAGAELFFKTVSERLCFVLIVENDTVFGVNGVVWGGGRSEDFG